jgi:hypothetical protein
MPLSTEIATALSEKISDRFSHIETKMREHHVAAFLDNGGDSAMIPDVFDMDAYDGSDLSSISPEDELFIRAFHSTERNGKSVYEYLRYADSPEMIEDLFFHPLYFEMMLADIRRFMSQHPTVYPSEVVKNPYSIVDVRLAKILFASGPVASSHRMSKTQSTDAQYATTQSFGGTRRSSTRTCIRPVSRSSNFKKRCANGSKRNPKTQEWEKRV